MIGFGQTVILDANFEAYLEANGMGDGIALNNTVFILVGDDGLAANLSGGGIKLNPGDFYSMDVNNVGNIYVLAETDGEDIYFTYFT